MTNQNFKFKDNLKKRSFEYSKSIIRMVDRLGKDLSTLTISRQVLRSSTSIGANLIEAQASSSRRDFKNFINHSLKSANESIYWLKLLKESKNIDDKSLNSLIQETKELASILGASMLTLKGRRS